jgi:hypothetical protein
MYTHYVFVRIWITDVNLRHSVTKIGGDNLSLSGLRLLLISLLRRSKSYHCMESRTETRWAARSIPISLTGIDISVLIFINAICRSRISRSDPNRLFYGAMMI